MKCLNCGADSSYIIDSRPYNDFIKRRRKCSICGHRWNTFEIQQRYCNNIVCDLIEKINSQEILDN